MIKLLACFFMVIDHIGLVFLPKVLLLRIIGRLSMPLFSYCIARGFFYSKKNGTVETYIKHMALFAVLSQIPYMLMVKKLYGNIGVTWLICLLIFNISEKQKKSKLDFLVIFALALLSVVLPIDYGLYGVGFTVIFFYFYVGRYSWNKFFTGYIILHIFYTFFLFAPFGLLQLFTLPCVLGLEFLKKHDNKIKLKKLFFYCFYPLHMLILVLSSYLLNLISL